MTYRPLLVRLILTSLLAACGGNRDENLSRACKVDEDCPAGSRCQAGLCEDDPAVTGGENELRASASAEGAPVEVEVTTEGGTCRDSACSVRRGATVTFRAPAADGYRFTGWSGDPRCEGTEPLLELERVDSDIVCVAHYVGRFRVRGEVDGENDSVAASSDAEQAACDGPQCEVDAGGTVLLRAPERLGFRFDGWSGDGCEDAAGVEVTVVASEQDVTCAAHYVSGFIIRGSAQGTEAAIVATSHAPTAVCAEASCQVDAGADATLTAPEVPGHRFTGWTGEAAACNGSALVLAIAAADADLHCIANYLPRFEVAGHATGASPLPSLQASSADTFATCSGEACEVDEGGSATLLAPTVEGYRLRAWSGDEQCTEQTGAAVTLSQVDHDILCSAEYVSGVGVAAAVVGAPAAAAASSNSPGAACSGANCVIDAGGDVTLSVTSPTGFTFAGWSGDPGCQSDQLTLTLTQVESSKTCVATFRRVRFGVNATRSPAAAGAIGSGSHSSTAVCGTSGCSVDYAADVTLSASPATGYEFTAWSGCSSSTNPTLTLQNITADHNCQANFARRRLSVTGTIAPAGAGSVTTPCGAATCSVEYGSPITLTAVASNPAYTFAGWSSCASGSSAQLALSAVTSSQTCTANFALRSYTVRGLVGRGAGTVEPCGEAPCSVEHGSDVTLLATPAEGYGFAGWSGDCAGGSPQAELTAISADRTCSADFALLRYALEVSIAPRGAGVISDPCDDAAQCAVSVSHGSRIPLTAVAADGYVFDHWSGCSDATTASTTTGPIASDQSCVANFRRRFRVTASVSPAGVGSVPDCFGAPCVVDAGASLTLRAPTSVNQDYVFSAWTGCSGSPANGSLTLSNIQSDLSCTAVFRQPAYTVTTAVSPTTRHGTVTTSCGGASCSVASGASLTLTATPLANFAFNGWSGCSTSRSASITLTVRSDLACTANFIDPRPDLVSTLELRGSPTFDGQTASVPVRVVVRNQGGAAASPESKVSIDFTSPRGTFVATFTVPGQRDTRYPFLPASLAAGATTTLDGTVTFSASQGFAITLQALADSCSGDELMPSFCRVAEISETNNTSGTVSLVVPAPAVVIGPVIGPVIIDRPITAVGLTP